MTYLDYVEKEVEKRNIALKKRRRGKWTILAIFIAWTNTNENYTKMKENDTDVEKKKDDGTETWMMVFIQSVFIFINLWLFYVLWICRTETVVAVQELARFRKKAEPSHFLLNCAIT